jgi:hypothetical protein
MPPKKISINDLEKLETLFRKGIDKTSAAKEFNFSGPSTLTRALNGLGKQIFYTIRDKI